MEIAKNRVVSFHYALRAEGRDLESSHGKDPVRYLHGAGNIVPGLERAMAGRQAGEKFSVTVAPKDAYGERNEGLMVRLSAKRLGVNPKRLTAGQVLRITTRRGQQLARVVKVGRFMVDLDANHPMAGLTLEFDIEIVDVREAEPDELAHRHAHGPGGHTHGAPEPAPPRA